MTAYTVASGQIGAHAKVLVADTQDTVTFTGIDLSQVKILTDGAEDIYVRTSAGSATVAGADCYRVLDIPGSVVLPVRMSGDTVIKLISSGTPTYSVERV